MQEATYVRAALPAVDAFPVTAWLIAAASFIIKCALALFTFGTMDVLTFRADVEKISSRGASALYLEGVHYVYKGRDLGLQVFSHPPSMIHILGLWHYLEQLTGLPLQFWMRITDAIADVILLALLLKIGQRVGGIQLSARTILLVASCPISILISGFHGNTDPIMTVFVVAAIYYMETGREKSAALCFGLALCIKIVPLIFGIAFLLRMKSAKQRVWFIAVASAVFFLGGLPYFIADGRAVVQGLTAYRGQPWILSDLMGMVGITAPVHAGIFLLSVVCLSIWMSRRANLFAQIGVIVFAFLTFAPGFALQYFAWGVPFIIYLGWKFTAAYYAAAGAFLLAVYKVWYDALTLYHGTRLVFENAPLGSPLFMITWIVTLTATMGFIQRSHSTSRV